MSLEYAPFGEEWVCRERGQTPKAEWAVCPTDDVPAEVITKREDVIARAERIAQHGYDPEQPPAPFARVTRRDGVDL